MPKSNTTSRIDDADIDRAKAVRVADVAVARGLMLKRAGRELIGPCPLCAGTDRFSIHADKDVFNCRACGGKGGGAISFLMWIDGVGFREAVEALIGPAQVNRVPPVYLAAPASKGSKDHDRHQRKKAAWLWSQRLPITGTIAETYLREARGIAAGPLPVTLAFLPPSKPAHFPAMISAFAMADEIEPGVLGEPRGVEAVHLTLLRSDGSGKADAKPNKMMIGSPSGKPIVVAPPNDLLGLAITEGIEDALSVHEATGLGAWAAGSAPHMGKLDGVEPDFSDSAIPDFVECVTIFADADADQQGERNASRLAERLDARGIEVTIEGLGDE
ncbi:phage/plasmid primase-like uncharacterized protein [Bradyrhizobium japonicum]|uniref:DUF7146 domain-containing protein n=1 Tax=Bradyrhizobium japonicum TaxID=375 RepID=UPI002166D104|nr:CHC2 zinc finger domain-containing protein [Bradyrhizobium japonicum]MCS3497484.1 phage/plasmid primase-like uncharacterized protein [Bradyrhizobium japonicum]MCS3960354.1 phage/plasmid primase-like uncharacterized protein [Bradyrhizobium japonicum]MCS4002108.1 phage/plasmid primase-like uncharacterized protein [Bradyrhizobium japonicum]